MRLSQILVLPPHQGAGLGRAMLQAAYQEAQARRFADLTVRAVMAAPPLRLQAARRKAVCHHGMPLCALPHGTDARLQVQYI